MRNRSSFCLLMQYGLKYLCLFPHGDVNHMRLLGLRTVIVVASAINSP